MRGDVHLLGAPLDAGGHEQRELRYAVVLQSDYLAELSTRLGRSAGRLTTDELAEADAALRIVLGLR